MQKGNVQSLVHVYFMHDFSRYLILCIYSLTACFLQPCFAFSLRCCVKLVTLQRAEAAAVASQYESLEGQAAAAENMLLLPWNATACHGNSMACRCGSRPRHAVTCHIMTRKYLDTCVLTDYFFVCGKRYFIEKAPSALVVNNKDGVKRR